MSISFETTVIWRKHVGAFRYPVEGTVKNFITVCTDDGPARAANVLVTADAGLCRRGDVITVLVADLEAAA